MKKYSTKQIGDYGEDCAVKYLKKKKFKIIQRNYRKKYGEIDIIAEYKQLIIFVEVKTRHSNPLTQPVDAVDKRKQMRLIKTASAFLLENNIDKYCRFDICEVFIDSVNLSLNKINYIEGAFEQNAEYSPY